MNKQQNLRNFYFLFYFTRHKLEFLFKNAQARIFKLKCTSGQWFTDNGQAIKRKRFKKFGAWFTAHGFLQVSRTRHGVKIKKIYILC